MAKKPTFSWPTNLFIDGVWRDAENGATFDVLNPATGELLFKCANASESDVNAATDAANRVFDSGVMASFQDRAKWLSNVADELEKAKDEFGWMESINMGKPVKEALMDMDDCVLLAREYSKLALNLETESEPKQVTVLEEGFDVRIAREPIGPVAGITPWNFPLLMTVQKVFAAIAAGCPIVLKPSELAPATTLRLCGVFEAAKVPAGVYNVVTGLGEPCGRVLASHPRLYKTAFTGSVATGRKVMAYAANKPFPTPVTLELGGKSPCVVFDDVPDNALDAIADFIAIGIFFNSGQVCSATSRLILHRNITPKLLPKIIGIAQKIRVCDPSQSVDDDPRPQMGPLVSAQQREKVWGYINQGLADGATLLHGGTESPAGVNPNGFFAQPTILANVPRTSRVWREEIFGPVLSVAEFDSEAEAVDLANDTDYGLAAAVMGGDNTRLNRVARSLRAGTVWINNNQRAFVQAPWGGFKGSGFGRELGREGVEEFLVAKTYTSTAAGFSYNWYA
jgi:betaine-aldehyde dehydrogenase